ncbi:MAG: Signal transduction histidine [Rhodospirillaceae bacterium]|nr:MAG: Signal transduction histidine [Rhodospirillaceae bacterium]TNC96718.1 MAG: Signal transduction histidine kinase [Stygiobacter sp.]
MIVVRRLLRPVPLAALALALCLCGLLALHLWRSHVKAEADARLITSTLGQAIEQHVAGQMRGIATLLDEVAAMVTEQGQGPPALAGNLGERLLVFPEITGLVLMRGNGDWVDLGSDEHLAPSQAAWLHDRLPGGAGLVIGPPHVQAGDGHRVQVVAWLFPHEDGTAAIATKLDVNGLSAFLQTVRVPETAMLAVIHRSSAKVVAAVPEPDGGFARDFPRPDAAIGTVLPVEGLDLDVWVMADQGSAFALWQGNAVLGGLLLVVLCAAILLWARRGDAAWCHLTRARDGLENLVISRGEELRRARALLEQKVRQVSAANREMQRLSMVTAHHLQEPLRPLVSYSQILLRRLPADWHDARARLERLIQGGKDMKILLRGFQQRVAALGIDAPMATVELRQVVQRAMVDADIAIPIRLGTLPALDVAGDGIPEVLVQVLRTLASWGAATIDVEAELQGQDWLLRISGGGGETAVAVRICQSLAGLNGLELSYGEGCFILALPSSDPSVVDAPAAAAAPLPRQFTARIQALALIAAVLVAMGWQMLRERDSAIHAAQVLTLAVANSIDQQISGSLRGIDTVLAEAAAMITRGEYLNRTFSVRMEGILRAYPEIRHISMADASGRMSTAMWPPRLVPGGAIDVSDRTYFQAARANARERSQMVVGDPVLGRINSERSLHVARPLVDDKGDFAGIVYASLDPDVYARFLDRVLLDRDGGTALIGANGRMIARAPAHVEKFGIDISSSDLFTRWLPQAPMGTAHLISKADGNDKYLAYRLLSPYPLVVTSAVSRNRALALWQRGLTGAVMVGTLLSVTLFLLAWTADRGMARIRRRQGELAVEVARRTQGLEAARALSDSRAASLDRLNGQLRDLLGVVTRDLQAPLAVLQDEAGRLAADLVAADSREKPEELDYVLAAIARLAALLRDFQRFVSITSMSAQPQKVDLGGLVRLAVDDMERRFGPAVLLVEAENLPTIRVDGGMMLELLAQIFTNAVTYGRRSQAVSVRIGAQVDVGGWRLDIIDDGPGFPPEQLSHDPQMFDTGIGQSADSTGIGLAICRVIAQAHGGELWLSNGAQGGAVISISLPEN